MANGSSTPCATTLSTTGSAARTPTSWSANSMNRPPLPVVLDNLIHAGEVAPLIAVMADPVNRMTEYRLNEAYVDFVVSELIPQIDGRFRTLKSSEGRGVM